MFPFSPKHKTVKPVLRAFILGSDFWALTTDQSKFYTVDSDEKNLLC